MNRQRERIEGVSVTGNGERWSLQANVVTDGGPLIRIEHEFPDPPAGLMWDHALHDAIRQSIASLRALSKRLED